MSEHRLMVRPRIAHPQEGSQFKPAVVGYDIVAIGENSQVEVCGEYGIMADTKRHLEIAAMFAASPVLMGAVEEAISQIEHMAKQLGQANGTGTSNAVVAQLKSALQLAERPRLIFENDGDEEILRQKLEDTANNPKP